MIRKLRRRPRSDTGANQVLRRGRGVGRWAYLAMLAALALGLGDYVWGDRLFLRADGVVLRDRVAIAATSVVRVEQVHVRRGQQVAAGDLLIRVGSAEILDRIAEQTSRDASLAGAEAALRSRLRLAADLLPLARARVDRAARNLRLISDAREAGLVPTTRRTEAAQEHFDARRELTRLSAERDSLGAEIAALAAARRSAREALEDLKRHYAGGRIRAPVAGAVGPDAPSAGEVYNAGEALVSIYTGETYVLAYLPNHYLFPIGEGMRVKVRDGRRAAAGVIVEILPVSDVTPQEFRTAFKPGGRRQLARVSFADASPFPAFSGVRITRPTPGPREILDALAGALARAAPW